MRLDVTTDKANREKMDRMAREDAELFKVGAFCAYNTSTDKYQVFRNGKQIGRPDKDRTKAVDRALELLDAC